MDYTTDSQQLKRVRAKLEWLVGSASRLAELEQPLGWDWVLGLERGQRVTLPEDYRQIIAETADGGLLPPFLSERYWRPLRYQNRKQWRLDQPLPAAPPEGELWDVDRLPGQIPLMGGGELGWSLLTAGPHAGEVWTLGRSGAARTPGCTFSQWLELVLDGNLGRYIGFCLTGEEGPVSLGRRLLDLLRSGPVWSDGEEPEQRCARWLERHRKPVPQPAPRQDGPAEGGFVYDGPSPNNWAGYLKSQLRAQLRPLPEECDLELAALRAAQRGPGWRWGRARAEGELTSRELKRRLSPNRIRWEDPEEVARLGRLVRAIQGEGAEAVQAGLAPEEVHLFPQAAELVSKRNFECRDAGIRDLSFLEGLTHLKTIGLRGNDVEDLGPVASLSGLRELSAPFNLISDLSPLAGLDKLVQLHLYGNQIASLEPLRGLTSLNTLNLRGNPLEPGALACLRKCKRLGMLDLTYTGLGDISGLEFCRTHILELNGNPDLTGLEVISTMKQLCCLYLDTQVARRYDVRALAPQLVEHAELGGVSVYTWPEKYYN